MSTATPFTEIVRRLQVSHQWHSMGASAARRLSAVGSYEIQYARLSGPWRPYELGSYQHVARTKFRGRYVGSPGRLLQTIEFGSPVTVGIGEVLRIDGDKYQLLDVNGKILREGLLVLRKYEV